jgi:EAL domain-containing protein (putative c-di-GMP-specific phosphodiesterase class I)
MKYNKPIFTKADFEQAFASNAISHHFQPLVDMNTRELLSFEVLARWEHPELGNINSGLFIFSLVEHGFASQLTLIAVEKINEYHKQTLSQGLKPVPVSINVTATEFEAPEVVKCLIKYVKDHELPPELITIEMLEWTMAHDLTIVGKAVKALTDLGVKVYADDFGDAYASFHRIMNIPFSGIKLDGEYARAVNDRPEARAIIKALVLMTNELNLQFVIEGVETQAQAEKLTQLGVRVAQGHYYHYPLDSEQAIRLLKAA